MLLDNVDIGLERANSLYYGKANHRFEVSRSGKWPFLRRRWLEIQPLCQSCGKNTKIQVHHIHPVHLYPELELDDTNLITLCENPVFNCHFAIGHCLNWLAWNSDVINDTTMIANSIRTRYFKRAEDEA